MRFIDLLMKNYKILTFRIAIYTGKETRIRPLKLIENMV